MVSVPSHTPNTPSPRPGGKVIVVHMLLIVPSVVLVLQGTLTHGVIWDSDQFGNVQGQLSDALSPSFWTVRHHEIEGTPFFCPLTTVTYLADKRLRGSDPLGYHLIPLLIHPAVRIALYFVIALLGTGLMPHYTTYHLARLKKIQGDFPDALNILDQAGQEDRCKAKCLRLADALRQNINGQKP